VSHRSPPGGPSSERGMVLVSAILILTVLFVLGTTAILQTSTDIKTAANYRAGKAAFYAAEAGVAEARSRMRSGSVNQIIDNAPLEAGWAAFIGTEAEAEELGYDGTHPLHILTPSLQSGIDYTVRIEKEIDGSGNIATNSSGSFVYLVNSRGKCGKARRQVEARISSFSPVDPPAALYVKAPATIQGSNTYIIGEDRCGFNDKPGLMTPMHRDTVTKIGNPFICGANEPCGGSEPWDVVGYGDNIDVQAMIDRFKGEADFYYNVSSATHTAMAWGEPEMGSTLKHPSYCEGTNIVHYNTNNTDIKLAGETKGCGLLLVEGNLEINGDFSWNGMVIVSGSVICLGGGDKNVTGALLVGGEFDADIVGGNTNIIYCSSANNKQTESLPWRVLSWKEHF